MKKLLIPLSCILLSLLLTLPITAEDGAPVAENLEFTTYRGVSFGGSLSAVSRSGEALCYELTTAPSKGKLSLNDDGSFVYTPAEKERGRDYFGYRAIDSEGRRSQEATVIITLQKQKSAVSYADTRGLACGAAAQYLSECGAFTGAQIGGSYYFEPEETVSRGEFLAMTLEVCGIDLLSGVQKTGFSDDESIPDWLKGYVSTAVLNGVTQGKSSDAGLCFDADAPISRAEAAVMLSRCLKLGDVSYIETSDTVPSWAFQAAANLSARGAVDMSAAFDCSLTRAEAATMLCAAVG